jgi:hypothetical protein
MGEFEAQLSNRKAREVLGFKEAHDWRTQVLNPALRRALGFTQGFYLPRQLLVSESRIFVIPDRRWLKGKFRKSGLTSLS